MSELYPELQLLRDNQDGVPMQTFPHSPDNPPPPLVDLPEFTTVDTEPAQFDIQKTLFFRDGERKIDYVLVYSEAASPNRDLHRKTFETNLVQEGLELEHEARKDGKVTFVKLHAPWDVLTRVAEVIPLKMPIKEYDIPDPGNKWCFANCSNPLALDKDLVEDPIDYFTADFSREREEMFIIKDRNEFFSNAQRALIVYELLLRTRYHATDPCKFGVDKLIKLGSYDAAYALHDGPYESEHSILAHGALNARHLLYETWASPSQWFRLQPLDLIRKYFGEKIALYFAWLGYYTYMLFPAAIIGIIVFFYGLANVFLDVPSREICDEEKAGKIIMCPLCDKFCEFWELKISCLYSKLSHIFDNFGTVFFAGFMAIWSTWFLEFWKRRQAVHQYDWDIARYDKEERLRPDYELKVKHHKLNPITQVEEPFMPLWSRLPRLFTSFTIVLFLVCCVIVALFGVIMYRVIMLSILYVSQDSFLREHAKVATSVTAAVLNLIAIMLLNKLYEKVAMWLTDLECQRTETDYEDSYIFKMFMFRFLNHYASIFYIAFFKGRIGGRPGDYDYKLGRRAEECDPAGCLIELGIQLGIVMVGKQTLNNFQEVMLPKIQNWIRKRRSGSLLESHATRPQWELDNDLADFPPLGLVPEYMEMVIQYGFITIFVAAFPLAPLFALLNNIIEIRLDAYKMVTQVKRPVPLRAQDIGIWFGILKGLTYVGIITNAFIIGWTSDFVPRIIYQYTVSNNTSLEGYIENSLSLFNVADFQNQSIPDINPKNYINCSYPDYREGPYSMNKYQPSTMYWHVFCARLAFIIVFEHCVLFATWLVAYIIPDVPHYIQMLILREMHLSKEATYKESFKTLKQERAMGISKRNSRLVENSVA